MDGQFESSAQAAATKIQALVRGRRSREQVNDYITELIEELLRSKKERKTRRVQKQDQSMPIPDVQVGAPYNEGVINQYQNNNTIDAEAEFEEEELIVLIDGDDDYDDDDYEEIETIVEIVTYIDCEDEKGNKIEKTSSVLIEEAGGVVTKVQKSEGSSTDKPTIKMTKDLATNNNTSSVLGAGGIVKTSKFVTSKKQVKEEMISRPIPEIPVVTKTQYFASKKSQPPYYKTTTTTAKMTKSTQPLPPPPPPPPTRRRHKSALVNRYLEAAVRPKESGSSSSSSNKKSAVVIHKLDIDGSKSTNNQIHEIEEIRRIAEIEKDKNRLGATVTARFSNRRQGTKLNDGENIIDSAQQQQQVKKETGVKEDEFKKDSDEYYDETERLPLWWMECVPHDTYNVEECHNNDGNPMGEISAEGSPIIDVVYRPLRTKDSNFSRRKTAVMTTSGASTTPTHANIDDESLV